MEPSEPSLTEILRAAQLIHDHPGVEDGELVEELIAVGFSVRDAELAIVFLPLAFARHVLLRHGIERLPESYLVRDRSGAWVERPIGEEPWYRAALRVATATLTHGYATAGGFGGTAGKSQVGAVVERSPEMIAASKAIESGVDIRGGELHPPRLLRLTAEELAGRPR